MAFKNTLIAPGSKISMDLRQIGSKMSTLDYFILIRVL